MINQLYNISGWVPTYEIAGETKSHWIYWYASLPYLETLCCLLFQSPFKIHWKHCSNKVVLSFPLSLTTWFFDRWSRRFLTYGKSNFNRWINIQNLVPHSKSNEQFKTNSYKFNVCFVLLHFHKLRNTEYIKYKRVRLHKKMFQGFQNDL